MKKLIPDCCINCDSSCAKSGNRDRRKDCLKWLSWFSKEWSNIRKAAGIVDENNEREGPEK